MIIYFPLTINRIVEITIDITTIQLNRDLIIPSDVM